MPQLTSKQKAYQQLVGLRFGVMFAACIGVMWTGLLVSLLGGAGRTLALATLLPCGAVCLALSIYMLTARRPGAKQNLPYLHSGAFWAKFYGVIAAECVIIFAVIRMFEAHHVANATFPLIVLIVGLHFYPLAYWNGNRLWYGTATVLVAGMIALFALVKPNAVTTVLGTPQSSVWSLASSGLMALAMLATSLLSAALYLRKVPARASSQNR